MNLSLRLKMNTQPMLKRGIQLQKVIRDCSGRRDLTGPAPTPNSYAGRKRKKKPRSWTQDFGPRRKGGIPGPTKPLNWEKERGGSTPAATWSINYICQICSGLGGQNKHDMEQFLAQRSCGVWGKRTGLRGMTSAKALIFAIEAHQGS